MKNMLRYKTKTRPGLVALYDIRPGNGAGPFLQPRSPHGATCLGGSHQWDSLYTPSSPISFPLGLHAPPLGSPDRACLQVEPTDSWREDGSTAYTHTRPINASSTLTSYYVLVADGFCFVCCFVFLFCFFCFHRFSPVWLF